MDEWARKNIDEILAESPLISEPILHGRRIHDHVENFDYSVDVSVEEGLVNFRSRLTDPIKGAVKNVAVFAKELLKRNSKSTIINYGLSPNGSIIAKANYPTYEHQDRLFFDTLASFEHTHKNDLPEIEKSARRYKIRI